MDPMWIGGLIGSVGVAVSGVLTAYSVLRKSMQPDSKARGLVQTIWDLMSAGVVKGVPRSVESRMRELLEVSDSDPKRSVEGE